MALRRALLGLVLTLVAGSAGVLTTAAGRDAIGVQDSAPGRLELRAVDAATGAPLPVRVQLVPSSLIARTTMELAPGGELSRTLAPGRYALIVSHGPEWSLFERTLVVEPGTPLALTAALTHEVDASAYTGCDLHVHTGESQDSDLSVAEREASLRVEDVQFAVLTDHNHVTQPAKAEANGPTSLAGVEVTSWAPEFGHFNVFPRKTAPRYKHTNVTALLHELRSDPHAFVQVNHPRLEHHIGYFEITGLFRGQRSLPELGFDGIEVWNGYDLTRPARRDEVLQDWLMLLERGKRLVATGGSDSHHLRAPHVGYPRTYVHVPRAEAHDRARVVAALKHGHAFVTSGPILEVEVEGKRPGDTLVLAPHRAQLTLRVAVSAPRWMDVNRVEIYADSVQVRSVALERAGGVRDEMEIELPVGRAHALVVVARGDRAMDALIGRSGALPYAFSNPIWLRHE